MYPQPKRPLGITLLSILFLWIGGFGTLFFPFFILAGTSGMLANLLETELHRSLALSIALASTLSIIWFGAYVLYLCIGIGLWRLRRWALKAIIYVQWLGIGMGVIACIGVARFQPLLAVGVGVWCIGIFACFLWYLMRPSTRWPFEATYALANKLPAPPAPPASKVALWLRITIGIGAAATVFAVFFIAVMSAVEKSFRASVPYNMALTQAQTAPCVVAKLGSPVMQKGSISGNLSSGSHSGEADFDIPIEGSKAKGTLHAEAAKDGGTWKLTDLTLYYADGQLHLLPTPSSCE